MTRQPARRDALRNVRADLEPDRHSALTTIPAELRDLPRWVVWRWGDIDPKTGKQKKPPYMAVDLRRHASSTDETTWSTFEQSVAVVEAGKADGVGFALEPPFVFVDLDAELSEGDKGAIMLTLDSYTETSPSGTGYHVLVKAALNGGRHPEGLGVFQTARFVYLTGELVKGTPATIEERQTELDVVLDRFLPALSPNGEHVLPVEPVDVDDQELLERAMRAKNGADFADLYSGKWEGRYSSQSEADLALVGSLAFWTGRDAARIDHLFRSSGLMRPKWDSRRGETSYGGVTIAHAIEQTTDVYTPSRNLASNLASTSPPGVPRPSPLPFQGEAGSNTSPPTSPQPHCWLPCDLVADVAEPPARPSLLELFYLGLFHLVSGESEALKTWLLLFAAIEEFAAGNGVVWIDCDDVGKPAILERLRIIGATDDAISERFAYILPDEPLADAYLADVLAVIRVRRCRLVVVDGFNPAMALHGLNPDVGLDVEAFYKLLNPIRKAGPAVALTDNVAKSRETRGTWAIGSERKRSKAEVHLGMRTIAPLVRGGTGRAKIEVHKDRPGWLQRPSPGLLVVEAGSVFTWRIAPDDSRDVEGAFRPTSLMLKVSRFLERSEEPQSRSQIEKAKLGGTDHVRAALDRLLLEGYAEEFAGKHKARLVRLIRPFALDGEDTFA